jgi:hypothetical protein
MTRPQRLTLLPANATLRDKDDRRLDCALGETKDPWVEDFIRRLDCAIADVARNT